MSNYESSGGLPTSVASGGKAASLGWDNVVAAVRTANKRGQRLLLTLTADNMTPIWIDLHTKRFYTELHFDDFPAEPLNPKLYAKPIDVNDPPFPWVEWKMIDALLWTVGEIAFAHKRASWLILGERYSLVRWPNLTQITYGSDDLNAVSMLANGLLTIDELALVAKIDVTKSQQLISTLSFMGVLRGTGAPRIPLKVAQAMQETQGKTLEELQKEPIEVPTTTQETELVQLPDYNPLLDEATAKVIEDANHLRERFERPAISSQSLPELPPELFNHSYVEQEKPQGPRLQGTLPSAEADDYIEDDYYAEQATLPETSNEESEEESNDKKNYREESASRFSAMPSFESILAQQAALSDAANDIAESEKTETKEKPAGLFGMLRKLRQK